MTGTVGQIEKKTQNRVIALFRDRLCYDYLGDRSDRYDRDPPTRVARVAELDGRVLWYDAEQRDWQPLLRNQTLAEGDRLRALCEKRLTDAQARIEKLTLGADGRPTGAQAFDAQ